MKTFFSYDRWHGTGTANDLARRMQKNSEGTLDPKKSTMSIATNMQRRIWDLPPSLTEHCPGILRLCYGLPVMLKNNTATELCATNGAEGTVVGWDAGKVGTIDILRTVFVLLKDPPRSIQLPGLPPNVIPVSSCTTTVRCLLPSGCTAIISRTQIPILPDFAMMDFGSQGRTRPNNPVDIRDCRSHQSIYTILSRSSSLEGTVILFDFDESYITSGMDDDLRREF